MRNLTKMPEPQILVENKGHWDSSVASNPTETNRTKYRHPEIKGTLLEETHNKCVYCESKIGHNCPGDIEHKIPKSQRIDLIFKWDNMTIACTECNRRKGEYYDPSCMFLDPYNDNVEDLVQHFGPLVFCCPGNRRSAITVHALELDSIDARKELIGRKIERIELIINLVERIADERNPIVKTFLHENLMDYCSVSAEYSGMVKTYVEGLSPSWADNAP